MNVTKAISDDDRDEVAGDHVGQPLNRRAAALRLGHHRDDLREQRLGADSLGPHDEPPVPLTVPPTTLVARTLLDRHRLAGHHRFVDGARPRARRRPPEPSRRVARAAGRRPARARAARPLRCRSSLTAARSLAPGRAAPDRAPVWLRARELQHLAEQHQRDDDAGRLEIDRDLAGRVAEGGGK